MKLLSFCILPLVALAANPEVDLCKYLRPDDPNVAMADAETVFLGTALESESTAVEGELAWTFRLWKVWKGEARWTADVRTRGRGMSCGCDFAVGRTYVVCASRPMVIQSDGKSFRAKGPPMSRNCYEATDDSVEGAVSRLPDPIWIAGSPSESRPIDEILEDLNAPVRTRRVRALAELADVSFDAATVLPRLTESLASSDRALAAAAWNLLEPVDSGTPGWEQAMEAASQSGEYRTACYAVRRLGGARPAPEWARRAIVRALSHARSEVRRDAASALNETCIGDVAIAEALRLRLVAEKDGWVRGVVAGTLGGCRVASPEILEALWNARDGDEDTSVRRWAAEALERLRKETADQRAGS